MHAPLIRRTATVLLAAAFAVAAAGTTASASEGRGNGKASAHSANSGCGEYCSTRDGSPSHNGNGHGKATGRPCAGCVGKADDKNPQGQRPNGSDANNGYECDGNSGIARTNPAHTGCTATTPSTPGEETSTPPAGDDTPEAPAPDVEGTKVVKPAAPPAVAPAVAPVVKGTRTVKTPEVLGVRLTRPVAAPNGPAGTLPFTGGETVELLLAAAALLVTGLVATRLGYRRRTA